MDDVYSLILQHANETRLYEPLGNSIIPAGWKLPNLVTVVLRFLLGVRLRMHRLEKLFAAIYLTHGLILSVFFTRLRFRLPGDPLLIGLAGIALFLAFKKK